MFHQFEDDEGEQNINSRFRCVLFVSNINSYQISRFLVSFHSKTEDPQVQSHTHKPYSYTYTTQQNILLFCLFSFQTVLIMCIRSHDESKHNENEINLISERPYLLSSTLRPTPLVTKHYSPTQQQQKQQFYTTTTTTTNTPTVIPTTYYNTQDVTEIDTAPPPTQTTQSSFSNTTPR